MTFSKQHKIVIDLNHHKDQLLQILKKLLIENL